MARRFRLRSASVRWTSAILAAVLLVVWLLGGGYRAGFYHLDSSPRLYIQIRDGALDVGLRVPPSSSTDPDGFRATLMSGWPWGTRTRYAWIPMFSKSPGLCASVPLIYPATAFGALAILGWYRHRRYQRIERHGWRVCQGCGYQLANVPPRHPCPECGHARPALVILEAVRTSSASL